MDGSDLAQLTADVRKDRTPRWSPDKKSIAFTSERDGNLEIYVMSADGSNQRNLSSHAAVDMTPAWSPDGARIAFTSGRTGGNDIYVIDVATGNLAQLTTHPKSDRGPVWSPDGSRLLFQSYRAGSADIWSMKADGTGLLRMTEHSGDEARAVWSPDGSRIAFEANWTGNANWGIYVMGTGGGSSPIRLTHNAGSSTYPKWSPIAGSAELISFVSNADGHANDQIYVIKPDGTGLRQLTDTERPNIHGSWDITGKYLVFRSWRDRNWEIYHMKVDGTGQQKNLTQNPANDSDSDG